MCYSGRNKRRSNGTDPTMSLIEKASSSKAIWTEEKIRATLASEPYNYQEIQLPFGLRTAAMTGRRRPMPFSAETGRDRACWMSALRSATSCSRPSGMGRGTAWELISAPITSGGRARSPTFSTSTSSSATATLMPGRLGRFRQCPVPRCHPSPRRSNSRHQPAHRGGGQRLILEVATVGRMTAGSRASAGCSRPCWKNPPEHRGPGNRGRRHQAVYLTISAIENLLRFRRGCFASVKIQPSGFKNRFLVVAEKRKIGQLLVVAGVPARIIRRLQRR